MVHAVGTGPVRGCQRGHGPHTLAYTRLQRVLYKMNLYNSTILIELYVCHIHPNHLSVVNQACLQSSLKRVATRMETPFGYANATVARPVKSFIRTLPRGGLKAVAVVGGVENQNCPNNLFIPFEVYPIKVYLLV